MRGWKCGCLPRLAKEGMGWRWDYSSMARQRRACSSQRCPIVIIWHAVVEMATIGTIEEPLLVSTIKGKKVERPLPILKMRRLKGEIGIVAKEDRSVLFEMVNTRVIIVVYGPQEVVAHPDYCEFTMFFPCLAVRTLILAAHHHDSPSVLAASHSAASTYRIF
ncbi:hypothetical protein GUJ93_ZPchr0015g6906 [Zizania palustris]|uniref:Uncharacterized protein n=1 Tax=Zizania palustris TaxID=103762 RepID=A0A8J5TDC2_ZIZPA|nr:hypothetical protein GUJ93_ZPchr0015g6906 [Zizania palustris]